MNRIILLIQVVVSCGLILALKQSDHSLAKKRKVEPGPFAGDGNMNAFQQSGQCLICCLNTRKEGVSIHSISGSNGYPPLNCQLWCTFLLKNLLKLPDWKYKQILKKFGNMGNPSEWFVVCKGCSETVNQIIKIQEQIRSLEIKAVSLKEAIHAKFANSSNEILTTKLRDIVSSAGNEIRSYFEGKV